MMEAVGPVASLTRRPQEPLVRVVEIPLAACRLRLDGISTTRTDQGVVEVALLQWNMLDQLPSALGELAEPVRGPLLALRPEHVARRSCHLDGEEHDIPE